MKIKLTQEEKARMLAALRAYEDAEECGDGSFDVDLYEPEPVLAIELYPEKDGFSITAAARMAYSEELDGWYMDERILDEEGLNAVAARLRELFL